MDYSFKNIITQGLGGLCIFCALRLWNTGESLLLAGTFAGFAVWLLSMNTENEGEKE